MQRFLFCLQLGTFRQFPLFYGEQSFEPFFSIYLADCHAFEREEKRGRFSPLALCCLVLLLDPTAHTFPNFLQWRNGFFAGKQSGMLVHAFSRISLHPVCRHRGRCGGGRRAAVSRFVPLWGRRPRWGEKQIFFLIQNKRRLSLTTSVEDLLKIFKA